MIVSTEFANFLAKAQLNFATSFKVTVWLLGMIEIIGKKYII